MDALEAALEPDDMNIPGWGFHPLKGKPKRYSVNVTGNWRITFGWQNEDAIHINLEDYH
jgi:proteic killer suppression protein